MYEHLASETETYYAKTEKEALTYTCVMEKLSITCIWQNDCIVNWAQSPGTVIRSEESGFAMECYLLEYQGSDKVSNHNIPGKPLYTADQLTRALKHFSNTTDSILFSRR